MLAFLILFQVSMAEELLSGTNYLRSVSLDLLGRLPNIEEYESIEDNEALPEELLDQWLSSEDFYDQVIYFHNLLLLNRLNFLKFQSYVNYFDLSPVDEISYIRRRNYRNGSSNQNQLYCSNVEAVFDDQQRPIPIVNPDGSLDEGYVWVSPYWDPENPIKVCAFEAQEREFTTFGVDCKTDLGSQDSECGCGPNLNWCTPRFNVGVVGEIQYDVNTQIDQYIRTVVSQDRPHTEIFTGDWLPINGRLTHMYKYLVFSPHGTAMEHPPFDRNMLPNLTYQDSETWVDIPALPESSGIFTLPGFLVRFATNRRRAERVLSEFLCTENSPPEEGLPESTEQEHSNGDLRQMNGCNYCHLALEPAAGFWGRWIEGGSSFVSVDDYPSFSEECNEAARQGTIHTSYYECRDTGYLVAPEHEEMVGWYWSHALLYEDEQHYPIVGPRIFFQQNIVNQKIPKCMVQKTAQYFLGRKLSLEDLDWKRTLAQDFINNNYNYKQLVRDIVTSEQYRSRK